ncbi:unnamed protein product, partial [Amoebophrya sp. A25]
CAVSEAAENANRSSTSTASIEDQVEEVRVVLLCGSLDISRFATSATGRELLTGLAHLKNRTLLTLVSSRRLDTSSSAGSADSLSSSSSVLAERGEVAAIHFLEPSLAVAPDSPCGKLLFAEAAAQAITSSVPAAVFCGAPTMALVVAHKESVLSLTKSAVAGGGASASGESSITPPDEDEDCNTDCDFSWAADFSSIESINREWQRGPSKEDEKGKPLKEGLINFKVAKYPPQTPAIARECLQLVGGATNSHCTGLYREFYPLIRPTEIEFEFTANGKIDFLNAAVVFTEKKIVDRILPDCKVAIQFAYTRGGLMLSEGGNLVNIQNDGKLKNDKWC